jgi:probable HAF family extracellular repeat protein
MAQLPFDINAAGQVVGTSYLDNVSFTANAFLYDNGVMTNLNSLIPANSGWVLKTAFAIDDAGVITGMGDVQRDADGVLAHAGAGAGGGGGGDRCGGRGGAAAAETVSASRMSTVWATPGHVPLRGNRAIDARRRSHRGDR